MGRKLEEVSQDIRYNPVYGSAKNMESDKKLLAIYGNALNNMGKINIINIDFNDGNNFFILKQIFNEFQKINIEFIKYIQYKMDIEECTEKQMQILCPHDVVLKLATPSGTVDVCPVCGKTVYALPNQKGRLIKGGPRLDFSKNSMPVAFIAKDSPLVKIFQQIIIDGAITDPDMNIMDLIIALLADIANNPDALNEYLKHEEQKLTKDLK